MRKSGFLTFCFSFIPGAGTMYQCYIKRGASLMLAFFVTCIFTWALSPIGFLLPVIWFISFFDTWNLRTQLTLGIAPPDDYILHWDQFITKSGNGFFEKRHKYIGTACIIIGLYFIFRQFIMYPLNNLINSYYQTAPALAYFLDSLFCGIPLLVVSGLIIWLGVRLIKGKKVPMVQNDDLVEFKGESNEQ